MQKHLNAFIATLTDEAAIEYVKAQFAKYDNPQQFEIVACLPNMDFDGALDVLFYDATCDDKNALWTFTVWIEPDGSIYGEW